MMFLEVANKSCFQGPKARSCPSLGILEGMLSCHEELRDRWGAIRVAIPTTLPITGFLKETFPTSHGHYVLKRRVRHCKELGSCPSLLHQPFPGSALLVRFWESSQKLPSKRVGYWGNWAQRALSKKRSTINNRDREWILFILENSAPYSW